jgi:DNA replication and repair protein RecF
MKVNSVHTHNFRNIKNGVIPTDHRHVLLVGDNGQGKSNILETIYMISYGNSFRSNLYRHIITFSHKEMSIIADIEEHSSRHRIKFVVKDGKRRIFIDDNEIKDRKQLFGVCTSIIFSHEDIQFITGSPSEKRRFFDQTISLIETLYIDDLRSYMAVVRQRNAVLRDKNSDLLPVYDQKMAEIGLRIQKSRQKTVELCNEYFPSLYKTISGEDVTPQLAYKSSWKNAEDIQAVISQLDRCRDRDLKYEISTCGPHRDHYSVMYSGRDYISTASTGQMRLIALILRSIQALLYVRIREKKPILLLDDVLLELDISKRQRFLDNLADYDQAFFTFLPDESYFRTDAYDSIRYTVKEGTVN